MMIDDRNACIFYLWVRMFVAVDGKRYEPGISRDGIVPSHARNAIYICI